MKEFNTGKINLETNEYKEKWYCSLCDDYHTEDKNIYDELFKETRNNLPDCKDVDVRKYLREEEK
ncbi:hypothetical protein [Turicibacter sp.]|uniref:hypothetical protein n=1 Tax=Turicibacter sp. TaxID=2049042 RepID=UPI001B530032|nr:hypothetical protein [Turicibacter sp.]MBP3904000.1 hypothetical protein [Turicibacter sp.]